MRRAGASRHPRKRRDLSSSFRFLARPKLEWGPRAKVEDRVLIIGPPVDRFGDIDVDGTKGRPPEQPHSPGILQSAEGYRLTRQERTTRIEEHVAAHTQRLENRE